MKRKEALALRPYDNDLFADLIRRYVHKETDRFILTMYFIDGKSIKEIAEALDKTDARLWSTRQIWEIKNKYGAFLFDLYDKMYGA
jgi:hypothetical protein